MQQRSGIASQSRLKKQYQAVSRQKVHFICQKEQEIPDNFMMKFNYNPLFDNIPDKLKAATIEKKELFVHEKFVEVQVLSVEILFF